MSRINLRTAMTNILSIDLTLPEKERLSNLFFRKESKSHHTPELENN